MTDKIPLPIYNCRPKMAFVPGRGVLETWIRLHTPLAIKAALMAYCSNSAQKGKPQIANLVTTRGGVIRPPTMANACCNPMSKAMTSGNGSSGYVVVKRKCQSKDFKEKSFE
jgi:hypothetical protein